MTHDGRDLPSPLPLAQVTLADKYDLAKTRVFISGSQAITRLLLMQKARDRKAGLNTAGFVSGYRGSPVGGLDQQFMHAAKELKAADVVFQPGLNEDLAATAIWGAQQAEMRGEGRYDGVFAVWYGKGPGVDRSGDVFRHANLAGTSKHGGVLVLMGDDHASESSTSGHQSEFHLFNIMIPILHPAGVQELIDYGLYGFALSRYAGVWVGVKCVKDNIESTAVVESDLDRIATVIPTDYAMPEGGLNIRPGDPVLTQEARLLDHKRDAIVAFLRANKINQMILSGGPNAKVGVITTGKSYLDARQALEDLGIDEVRANALGLRLYKLGCVWPIEPQGLREFADGLDLIIVIEEKRSLIEMQVREELYGAARQPLVIGKKDEMGASLFPAKYALDTNDIAIALGERLSARFPQDADLARNLSRVKQAQAMLDQAQEAAQRTPYFCSGCPHNSSTRVPEGMRAYAGIGCHYMVQWMDRATEGFTQMGGEGANWVGEAPFSTRGHVFQNIGDGTYNHSGVLAIRFAIGSGVNMTYKILYNDAVAMTGGQAHDGGLTVDRMARQVAAEGVRQLVLVTDDPTKYPTNIEWPAGLTIRPREELDAVQRELAAVPGVTALIFDQTCAAEKRRRRKRGSYPDPDKRVIINELVCEGCGDCGVQSNCVSVQPVETEFGRKRRIDQGSCNKDFSCVNGFCPSFVTVHGAKMKKAAPLAAANGDAGRDLPMPHLPDVTSHPFEILVTGVGGTGVVTIGAILGMAAHLEGKGAGIIDMTGIAQKGGAVFSHVKIGRRPEDIHAIRIAAGQADLVLGCDLVVSGMKKVLAAVRHGHTGVIVNMAETYPGDFTRNADFTLPTARIKKTIREAAGETAHFMDASRIAGELLGSPLATNMFTLGFAWQKGFVPLSQEAIFRALELNREAVEMNKQAFVWGRRMAVDGAGVEALLAAAKPEAAQHQLSQGFDEIVARRVAFLTAYQNAAYGERYRALALRARTAEQAKTPGREQFAEAVARNLFKLMAVKDEYEVARLYTDGAFLDQVKASFEGDLRFEFHLAPPLLGRRDPHTGLPVKSTFGPRMMVLFRGLAALKGLRGTLFDIFGYTQERREERKLIGDYEALLEELMRALSPGKHATAVALAAIPEKIRGFGHVKLRHLQAAKAEEAALLAQLRAPTPAVPIAAE